MPAMPLWRSYAPARMTEHEPDPGELIERFYECACQGLPLDLSSADPVHSQSVFGATWPEDRTVPAAVIAEVAARAREPGTSVRTLHVRGARIIGALDLMRMILPCPLMLDGCWLEGPLMLRGCELASLRLAGCTLNEELDGRGMTIRSSVELNHGLVALDRVSLDAAKVGTWLDCTGGHFHSRDGVALSANDIRVAGDVLCGGARSDFDARRLALPDDEQTKMFVAFGEVRFAWAQVGGQLYFSGGQLRNPKKMALFADSIKVNGRLAFGPESVVEGQICLRRAEVGGQLRFEGEATEPSHEETGTSDGPGVSLHLEAANIKRALAIKLKPPAQGIINLINATVGYLKDDETSWTDKRYALYGLRFGQLGGPREQNKDGSWREERASGTSWGRDNAMLARRAWLRGDRDGYHAQLYDQLAENYARIGHEASRRSILISKQWDRRKSLSIRNNWLNTAPWILNLASWALIGYGYRPHRALYWFVALFVISFGYFDYRGHQAVKPHEPLLHNPHFSPAIYTLDLLLPVINLGQREYWIARPGIPQDLSTVLIIAGWLLATVFLAGVSGLVRRYNE
jgi:hypothetical protein